MESAITLPLLIFMILGTLQLFMMLQARILAQYAVYKAARAGSLNGGDCIAMRDAAVAALLPSITVTDTPALVVAAYRDRRSNRYNPAKDSDEGGGFSGPVVNIIRLEPTTVDVPSNTEDTDFDEPRTAAATRRIRVRMAYFYRLKIPFANWVMTRIFLARAGLEAPPVNDPTMPITKTRGWVASDSSLNINGFSVGNLGNAVRDWSRGGHYIFPIEVNAAMRMMTPTVRNFVRSPQCD